MPEARLAKTRRSLPEGYQFGDARPQSYQELFDAAKAAEPRIGIAIRFVRQFDITPDPAPVRDDWFPASHPLVKDLDWNVIEGEH